MRTALLFAILVACGIAHAEDGKFTPKQDSIFRIWNERDSIYRAEMKSMNTIIEHSTGAKKMHLLRSFKLLCTAYKAEMQHYINEFDAAAIYEVKRPDYNLSQDTLRR